MFVYRLAVLLASAIMEIIWRTCRIRIDGAERLSVLVREHRAVVPVFWHQHLLICGRYVIDGSVAGLKPGFMISPSVDGQAPTMLATMYGAHVIRGSGSYTGVRAVRGVHQAIVKDGISPAITPDGPRGPRFVMKPGAIFIAQMAGKPVVPIAFAAKTAWLLKTWDKFVIPAPFTKVCIAIGEPFFPAADLDGGRGDERMEPAQRELERLMLETYRRAKEGLGAE